MGGHVSGGSVLGCLQLVGTDLRGALVRWPAAYSQGRVHKELRSSAPTVTGRWGFDAIYTYRLTNPMYVRKKIYYANATILLHTCCAIQLPISIQLKAKQCAVTRHTHFVSSFFSPG